MDLVRCYICEQPAALWTLVVVRPFLKKDDPDYERVVCSLCLMKVGAELKVPGS